MGGHKALPYVLASSQPYVPLITLTSISDFIGVSTGSDLSRRGRGKGLSSLPWWENEDPDHVGNEDPERLGRVRVRG